ncbi:VWA domain-containing protein [Helicobacter suis]|uniref:VWA domain-containing protein n=1 Tax=Helicobacter suis TaxID=104628 RepID=UPI001F084F6E|nr:VWA domain-containing protein [Helicobacter suis]
MKLEAYSDLLKDKEIANAFEQAKLEKEKQIKQALKDHPFRAEKGAYIDRSYAKQEAELVEKTTEAFSKFNPKEDLSFIKKQQGQLNLSSSEEQNKALHQFILQKWEGILESKIKRYEQQTIESIEADFLERMLAWFKALLQARELAKKSPELFGKEGMFMDAKGLALESLNLEKLGDEKTRKQVLDEIKGLDMGGDLGGDMQEDMGGDMPEDMGGEQHREGTNPFRTDKTDLPKNMRRQYSLKGTNPTRLNLAHILALFEQIKHNKALMDICDMLGRMQEMQKEMIKEIIKTTRTYSYTQTHPTRDYKEEICGIHLDNDLENVIPQELTLLNDSDLELLFDLKYITKQLFCFEKQGFEQKQLEDIEEIEEEVQKEIEKQEDQRGPIIICVDTSGSMHGAPEITAKAITLALASRAKREKRGCYLINFSTQTSAMDLSKAGGMARLNQFLTMSFGGGTDVQPALHEGLQMMQRENYKKADLLVISDGYFGELDNHITQQMQQKRRDENHFYLLDIDGNSGAKRAFDKHWVYDSHNKNTRVLCQLQESL